jgi:hypothetical protein
MRSSQRSLLLCGFAVALVFMNYYFSGTGCADYYRTALLIGRGAATVTAATTTITGSTESTTTTITTMIAAAATTTRRTMENDDDDGLYDLGEEEDEEYPLVARGSVLEVYVDGTWQAGTIVTTTTFVVDPTPFSSSTTSFPRRTRRTTTLTTKPKTTTTFAVILAHNGTIVHNLSRQEDFNIKWRLPCMGGGFGASSLAAARLLQTTPRRTGPISPPPVPQLSDELLDRFIVIPEYKLLFCYVEKVRLVFELVVLSL